MIKCPNCGKELEDGSKFCDECGTQFVEEVFCPNCGGKTTTEFEFCPECGASLTGEAAAPSAPATESALGGFMAKLPKNFIKIGAICIAAVVAIIIAVSFLSSMGKKADYTLYMKDGQMYGTKVSKIKPAELTKNLENNYTYAMITKDGSKLFYYDYTKDGKQVLYCRDVNKPKKDAIKIDYTSNYSISSSGKLVTYLKDNTLYQHNLKDKEKVASGVAYFVASKDGKQFIYANTEGNIYYKKSIKKDKEKLASDVSLEYVTENFKTIYFTDEDGDLYKQVIGKDKVKLASDVSSVIKIYDSGEIYYTESNGDEDGATLYYFNGKKETEICNDYSSWSNYNDDKAIIAYKTTEGDFHVAIKGEDNSINADNVSDATISENGKTIYYLSEGDSEEDSATLYKAAISGKKVKSGSTYDSDVYSFILTEDEKVIVKKEYNPENYTYDLYLDGKKVSGDVYTCSTTPKGDLVYIKDYNTKSSTGDLYAYKGNKSKQIDTDVSRIISVYQMED